MVQRECVYVIGAGFSAGLGYPLTSNLLVRLWKERKKNDNNLKERLKEEICFHHPGFNPGKFSSFPNIEQLLSEMQVKKQLFDASHQYVGSSKKKALQELKKALQELWTDILFEITVWFHEIHKGICPSGEKLEEKIEWLGKFKKQVEQENAAIISFNWDLILDRLLFEKITEDKCYGFPDAKIGKPILLKPHGSLNWFEQKNLNEQGKSNKQLDSNLWIPISKSRRKNEIYAFREFRSPKPENRYTPLVIPPVYNKDFSHPVFKRLWRNCVSVLGTTKKVVFLGYSMPSADIHAQFILHCGFHNQVKGEIDKGGKRKTPTGKAKVIIVNPCRDAACRISSLVRPDHDYQWFSDTVSEWVMRPPSTHDF